MTGSWGGCISGVFLVYFLVDLRFEGSISIPSLAGWQAGVSERSSERRWVESYVLRPYPDYHHPTFPHRIPTSPLFVPHRRAAAAFSVFPGVSCA